MSQALASLLAPESCGRKHEVSHGELKFIDLCEESKFFVFNPSKKCFRMCMLSMLFMGLCNNFHGVGDGIKKATDVRKGFQSFCHGLRGFA